MRRSIRIGMSVAPSLVIGLLLAAGQAQAGPVRIVALSGAANGSTVLGPGLAGGFFSDLGNPVASIARSGDVIFRAGTNLYDSTGNTGAGGIWTWSPVSGVNTQRVSGDQAAPSNTDPVGGPFTGTYTTSGFNAPILNSAGHFAFRDAVSTSGGLFTSTGALGRVAGLGMNAPTIGATVAPTFSAWGNSMNLNAGGSLAFYGNITGGTPAVVTSGTTADNTAWWFGSAGSLSLAVRQNDPTGIPNVFVGAIGSSSVGTGNTYNDNGRLLFTNTLQGAGTTTTTNRALLSTRTGSLEVVARAGTAFPDSTGTLVAGVPSTEGAVYNVLGTGATNSGMNNAGRIIFQSTLHTAARATPTTGGTSAIFSDRDGTLKTVARHTQPLPSTTNLSSLNWGSTFGNMVINGANQIAFTNGGMTGTDPNTGVAVTSAANAGLFRTDSSGNLRTIFRTNDPAPAYSAVALNPALNQNAGTVLFGGTPSAISMNSLGQMVFAATLTGTGIVTGQNGNRNAIFGVDADGSIFLIAQQHMLFEVAPGDFRIVSTIGSIAHTGGQDGRSSNIDEFGRVVFQLGFTDAIGNNPNGGDIISSTGIFTFQIPAPSSAAMLGLGGLLAARRRRA